MVLTLNIVDDDIVKDGRCYDVEAWHRHTRQLLKHLPGQPPSCFLHQLAFVRQAVVTTSSHCHMLT